MAMRAKEINAAKRVLRVMPQCARKNRWADDEIQDDPVEESANSRAQQRADWISFFT